MIRKGEPWGAPVRLTGAEPVAADDAELARLLAGERPPELVVLTGGDLHHSLGGRAPADPVALPVDLLEVTASRSVLPGFVLPRFVLRGARHGEHLAEQSQAAGEPRRFVAVAHVVSRRRAWRGEFAVAMGGTHLGRWNLGPKAHPNDGLVDVTRGALPLRDRWMARSRAVTGTHVPHPSLRAERSATVEWHLPRPTPLYVDGVPVGRFEHVAITVSPDRGRIVVG